MPPWLVLAVLAVGVLVTGLGVTGWKARAAGMIASLGAAAVLARTWRPR